MFTEPLYKLCASLNGGEIARTNLKKPFSSLQCIAYITNTNSEVCHYTLADTIDITAFFVQNICKVQ